MVSLSKNMLFPRELLDYSEVITVKFSLNMQKKKSGGLEKVEVWHVRSLIVGQGSTWVAKITRLSPCHDLSQFSVSRVDFLRWLYVSRVDPLLSWVSFGKSDFQEKHFKISFMQSLLFNWFLKVLSVPFKYSMWQVYKKLVAYLGCCGHRRAVIIKKKKSMFFMLYACLCLYLVSVSPTPMYIQRDWLKCGLRAAGHRLQAAGCGPQIAGCGYAGHRLRAMWVAGHRLRAAGHKLRTVGHRLQAEGMRAAGHRLRAMGHRLRAKCGLQANYLDPSLCD